jgi:phage shock protein PspC (stress-responsive transcriptional regulator)
MTDEAAEPRRQATEDGGRTQPALPGPAPSTPAAGAVPEPGPEAAAGGSGATTPSGGPTPPPDGPPPPPGAGFTSRYGLVRPREGRYLAGVCAAIGRATNTDPVLWRVLLAVLGFFGGIGILVYVAAWLIIPGEGDTASPVESMLGRGRSSMSPVTVIVLSILVAVSFGFIVTDKFRAVLLGAAILIGGALLLNRAARGRTQDAGPAGPPGNPPPGTWAPVGQPTGAYPPGGLPPTPTGAFPTGGYPAPVPPAASGPAWTPPPAAPGYPGAGFPAGGYPAGGYPAAQPAGQPPAPYLGSPAPGLPPASPVGPSAADASAPTEPLPVWPATVSPAAPPPVVGRPLGPPAPGGGYRPAFAPHGPYAPGGPYPPRVVPPAKPPKPPRERSPLGAATFSMIFVAIGAIVLVDLANLLPVAPSAYFAAALATIALGLLVGAWFGRARWLIVLGLVASAALGIATVGESYDRVRGTGGNVTWSPASYQLLADRYENSFGDATLDLRQVDFANQHAEVSVSVNFGRLTVLVPPHVDVTTRTDVNAGDAIVFGSRWSGFEGPGREATDLGADGAGGGELRLNLHVNAGDVEVSR